MDQEKKFLESHQARVNAIERSQRLQHADTLHVFWTLVREKLSAWKNKLHALQETQGKKPGAYQNLQDLKEELQLLRKHCLGSTVCFDDWHVPDLPVADLRLLHNEFSKHFNRWEAAKEITCPKGKFTFRRYREEMARRKAQGIPLSAPLVAQTTITSKPQVLHKGACLQDISNESITIDSDGNVRVRDEQIMKVSDAALLVRNLQNCSVVISKKLVTLHIVETFDTEITLEEPARAVHITDCQTCSLKASAQQLRLHKSTDLTCNVEVTAGAILEDCTGLVFYSEAIEVNDFNWLRSGIPSPNFEIKPPLSSKPSTESTTVAFGEKDSQENEADMKEADDDAIVTQMPQTIENEAQNERGGDLEFEDDDDDDEL